ncbi:MAG TPA: hypothetical protein VN688_06300 [Gemmataceae bacterium]|nr:hypothetical protein [Gemmataceae bacterium]
MRLNPERVRENVRNEATENLLDDATVYREGMEQEPLDIIEEELRARGVTRDAIAEHERKRRESVLFDGMGIALKCHKCRRPAVGQSRDWHYLWGLVPLFPRRFAWCEEHKRG